MWRIPKYMWPNSYLTAMDWMLMKKSGLELAGETNGICRTPKFGISAILLS